jgi:hypothetical protein
MSTKVRTTTSGRSRAIPERVAARAAAAYVVDEMGCWISTYSLASHGYAQIGWNEDGGHYGTTAHRAAWTFVHGPIPEAMTIDHLCHVRRCVNPDHLRAVHNITNATDNGMEHFKTRTPTGRLCGRGMHEMVKGSNGATSCRECAAERRRIRKARAV